MLLPLTPKPKGKLNSKGKGKGKAKALPLPLSLGKHLAEKDKKHVLLLAVQYSKAYKYSTNKVFSKRKASKNTLALPKQSVL